MRKLLLTITILLLMVSVGYTDDNQSKSSEEHLLEEVKGNPVVRVLDKLVQNLEKQKLEACEKTVVASLKSIFFTCLLYKDSEGSYPANLKIFASENPKYGKLLSHDLANDGKRCGYFFRYALTKKGYIIVAVPITLGVTGDKQFFLDETAIIRFTDDGTEPSVNSKIFEEIYNPSPAPK